MRTTQALFLAALVSATFVPCAAMAGDTVYLTPPLFREQARETQRVRSQSDLTTTPQPVAAAERVVTARALQMVAEAEADSKY